VAVTGGNLARLSGSGFFASQRNPDFGPMRAYDDDNESEFAVFAAHAGFVGGNFPPARGLAFYALTSGRDAPDPREWSIEGGPNSAGPWTVLAAGDWNFSQRKESRAWPITNNAAFPSFRITFPTNHSATAETYIGDLRLFEFKPVAPLHAVEVSQPAPGQAQVTFAGAPGGSYVAQFTADLLEPWVDFSTNTVPAGGVWTVADPGTAPTRRFYRLRQ
jgi:hypothetical protein